MNTGELIALLRSELGGMNAELISDMELIQRFDEAYKMVFRLTGGIPDMDSSITEIDVMAGDYEAPLDESILRVNKAVRRSDGVEVTVIAYTDLVGKSGTAHLLRESGQVKYMVMGVKPHYARWAPIPSADDTIDLIVERLPVRSLTTLADKPSELDSAHHWMLLDWVKSRTYQRPGTSFFNLQLATAFEQKFRDNCASLRRDKERFKSKVRTVGYGGL